MRLFQDWFISKHETQKFVKFRERYNEIFLNKIMIIWAIM